MCIRDSFGIAQVFFQKGGIRVRRRRSPRLPLCTNLVQNHSFEAGFDNWRFSGPLSFATDQPFAGNQAVRMLSLIHICCDLHKSRSIMLARNRLT